MDAPVRVLSDGEDRKASRGDGAASSKMKGSTGAVQAGPIGCDAPVRVLSRGDNAGVGLGVGNGSTPPMETVGSLGALQAGTLGIHAPVRVISNGNNGYAHGKGAAGGSQMVRYSIGGALVSSVRADAPVRVLQRREQHTPVGSDQR